MKKLLLALLLLPLLAFGNDLRYTGTFSGPQPQPAAGMLMRSNATSWLPTTATFADTYTSGGLLFSNGANTVQGSPFITFTGTVFSFAGDNPAADLTYNVTHTGSNAASRGVISVAQGGAGGGDAVVQWILSGVQSWTAGADISASNAWKLSAGTALGTNDAISVSTAGAVTIPGTLASTGTFTPAQVAGIVGTTTNNSAQAGSIGEYIESVVASGSSVPLTTGVDKTVTSISLTAGDWDLSGQCGVTGNAATMVQTIICSPSVTTDTTSAVTDTWFGWSYGTTGLAVFAASSVRAAMPTSRISLASTTTYYLVHNVGFSVNTAGGFGRISARRVR